MAVYDLEEQEQLEDLKAWWHRWGNGITAVVVAICVAVVGVQGWRWWKLHQSEQASTLYAAATMGMRANELAKTRDAVSQLTDRYPSTLYASSGALLLARMLYDKGDKAGAIAQLQWVIDHGDDEARDVARYRLAELQLDAKQYDAALQTLEAKHDPTFDGIYADLRGDVLSAAGKTAEARTAYEVAVAKLDAKSPYRNYVQVKLDALGGPTLAAASPGSGAPASPDRAGVPPAASGSGTPPPPAPRPSSGTPPSPSSAPAPTTAPAQ